MTTERHKTKKIKFGIDEGKYLKKTGV